MKNFDISIIIPENEGEFFSEISVLLKAKLENADLCGIECIVLGLTEDTALTDDGYRLVRNGKILYIYGRSARGVRQGAVCFLEDYIGCRFFSKDCEVIIPEKAKEIPDGLNYTYNPTFDFRCSFYRLALADESYDKLHKLNPIKYAKGMRGHTLYDLAEMSGTRAENIGIQPCLTDEKVYSTVLGNVRKWLREEPDATVISVSQNDSYEHQLGCHCEKCSALNAKYGTEGGALFEFVNRIARDIKPEFPNVLVETFAYRYSVTPPENMKFEDNVLVQLCIMDACYNHTIDDTGCPQNYRFAGFFENWAKVCKHMSVWDYHVDFAFYQTVFPNYSILYDHIKYYSEHNVVSVFNEANFNSLNGQFEELRSYICSQLMWNPQMSRDDYNGMIDEFCKYFYGKGWKYIREFIDITENAAKGDGKRHFSLYASPDAIIPFEPSFADCMIELFDKALKAAETEEEKRHIEKSSIQALYYKQFCTDSTDKETNKKLYLLMRQAGIDNITECARLREVEDFSETVKQW